MTTIITKGKVEKPYYLEHHYTCWRCNTVFSLDGPEDVKVGLKTNESYTICPVCGTSIQVNRADKRPNYYEDH